MLRTAISGYCIAIRVSGFWRKKYHSNIISPVAGHSPPHHLNFLRLMTGDIREKDRSGLIERCIGCICLKHCSMQYLLY